jgi:hypothetical protein
MLTYIVLVHIVTALGNTNTYFIIVFFKIKSVFSLLSSLIFFLPELGTVIPR